MDNIKIPILLTTVYLVLYSMLPALNLVYDLIFILFVISQFMVVWLVIRVLKDGKPSGKKFNEGYWYDDLDYKALPE